MFIFRIWVNLCTPRRGVCNQGVCQCENGSSAQNVSFPWRYHGAQIAGPNIAKIRCHFASPAGSMVMTAPSSWLNLRTKISEITSIQLLLQLQPALPPQQRQQLCKMRRAWERCLISCSQARHMCHFPTNVGLVCTVAWKFGTVHLFPRANLGCLGEEWIMTQQKGIPFNSGILCLNLRGIKVFADKFPLSRKTPTRASDVLMREKFEIWQAMCTCVAMRSCILRHLNWPQDTFFTIKGAHTDFVHVDSKCIARKCCKLLPPVLFRQRYSKLNWFASN